MSEQRVSDERLSDAEVAEYAAWTEGDYDWHADVGKMARELAALRAAGERGWISVEQELPALDLPVDLYIRGFGRFPDMQRIYDDQAEGYLWCFGESHLEYGEPIEVSGMEMVDVTHWMPLPSPPAASGSDAGKEPRS